MTGFREMLWNGCDSMTHPLGWNVTFDLEDRRVRELLYDRPAGYIVIGFAGEVLLTRRWVE